MKKNIYIIGIFVIVFLIVGCFYLVFSRNENLTITYIKFKINSEFVVGINSNDKVVMYNPLNEEAKIFNLGMFSNKTLEEMCKIFIKKIEDNDYLENNKVDITIMTKNLEKRKDLYKLINDSINGNGREIYVNVLEPSNDELIAYSNEVTYDLKATYQTEDLIKISESIKEQIKGYVDNKIDSLHINKFNGEQQKEILESNYSLGYFNDFDMKNVVIEDDIIISTRSNYDIEFIFNNDFTYDYNIILYLEFDYYCEMVVDDVRKAIVEVYEYTYNTFNIEVIGDYKNHFYKFNY